MRRALRIAGVALGVVLALVLVLVGAALIALANGSVLGRALPAAARAAGYEVTVGEVEHSPGRELVAKDVVVAVKGQAPLVEARALTLRYSLARVLHGELEITSLVIDAPAVHLVLLADGSLAGFGAAPAASEEPPSEPRPLLPLPVVRIGSAELHGGRVDLDDQRAGNRYEAHGVEIRLTGNGDPRHLDAVLGIERATLVSTTGSQALGPVALEGAIDGGRIALARLALEGAGGRIAGTGSYDLVTRATEAHLRLDHLEPGPLLTSLGVTTEVPSGVAGTVEASGTLPAPLTATARLTGVYRDAPLDWTLDASGSTTGAETVTTELAWSGVVARAEGRVDFTGAANDLAVTLAAESLAPLARFPGLEELRGERTHLAGQVTGALASPHVEIREGRIDRLGFATTTVASLRVRGTVEAPEGALAALVELDDLRSGDAVIGLGRIEARGTLMAPSAHLEIGPELRGDLRYDRAAAHAEIHLVAPRLPLDPFLALGGLAGAKGQATGLVATVAGDPSKLATLRGQARIESLAVTARGARLASVRPISLDLAEQVAKLDAALTLGRGSIEASGTVRTDDRALAGTVNADLHLEDLTGFVQPLAPTLTRLAGQLSIHGRADGTLDQPRLDARARASGVIVEQGHPETDPANAVSLRVERLELDAKGSLADLDGAFEIPKASARVAGRSIDELEVHATAHGGAYEVTRIAAVADGVPIEARGRLSRERALDAQIDVRGAPLTRIPELARANLAGALTVTAHATGPLARPAVEANVSIPELTFRERALGALKADARLAGDTLTVSATLPQGATANAQASLAGTKAFQADADVPGLDLAPLLALLGDRLPPALRDAEGSVVAKLTATGELTNPAALAGTVTLSTLHLAGGGQALELAHPAVARIRGGTIDLDELALDLGNGGRLALAAHGRSDDLGGSLTLDLDPRSLNPFLDGVELGPGKIGADVRFRRANGAVTAEGLVNVSISTIGARALPAELSEVTAALVLHTERAELTELAARIGDGEIHGTAVADLRKQSLEHASVEFVGVPYRVPGTLRVLASGHLEGRGSRDGSEIGGEVRIDDALYERDVEMLAGLVRPLSGAPTARSVHKRPAPMLDRIQLGVKVGGPETLMIRNNVAHATMRADLSVEGTAARPQLLGEVDVVEGTLTFFDRSFEVSRGTMVFDNPIRIDPRLDFEATSTVDHAGEDLNVRLALEGVISKGLALTLDSEPPYPQDDLVFLLATGKTRDEALAGGGGGAGVTGLSLSALDLIGGKLAKRHLGVSEFGLAEGDQGGTRLTVGKRISDRMQVRVVDEIGRETNLALEVEYQVTDRVVVVAEPQSTGAFAAEVRLRFEFR